MRLPVFAGFCAWLVTLSAILSSGFADEPVTVFGAASLTNALQEAGKHYQEKEGIEIRFSFASSSTLARQIEAGAPAQIYGSASEKWMDYLAEKNLLEDNSRQSPIGNRLVLIAPADSLVEPVTISANLDLAGLLGGDGRLAVGDPAHVPAGIYGKQALETLSLWASVEPKLARTDNVRAALALVERGEAPLGIVYATDAAISSSMKIVGMFPSDSHQPITYPFAIVKGQSSEAVRGFFDFLVSEDGLAIFEHYGFARNRSS